MFTDLVKNLADKNNVQISKMLKDLNLADGSFNNWKNRNTVPSGTIVAKIAQYFNVSTDYLLGLTDDTAPNKRTSALSGSEHEMLSAYRQLDDSDQGEVRGYINGMLTKEKYKIHNEEAIG